MKGFLMKTTVTKYENIDVEIDEEQVEYLMCLLLKSDYEENKDIFKVEAAKLLDAMKVVYEAYSGKPIDYLERFAH